jgi:integrase
MGNSGAVRQHATLSNTSSLLLTHSQDHLNCAACEKSLMFAVQEQKISHFPFREASAIWLEQHRIYISHRTYTDYLEHLRRLNEFFANLPLDQIHIGHVREYQKLRLQSVGNEKINKEISALQQILKEAKLWKPLAEFYKPLRIDREGSGKSMTPEQERALLWATDQVGPRAELAAHCIRIILRFGRGLGELKRLRRRNVDLQKEVVHWPATKTHARAHTVPIPKAALESFRWLIERWEELGGTHPDDFLLPHRANKAGMPTDFTKPMGSIKKGWKTILKLANRELEKHNLEPIDEKFRLYDLRPHTISKALGSGKSAYTRL